MFWLSSLKTSPHSLRTRLFSDVLAHLAYADRYAAKSCERLPFYSSLSKFVNGTTFRQWTIRPFTTQAPLRFDCATCICPHPSKANRGGEDAAFSNDKYLGVADGVGSWIEVGVDPGFYSRELLYRVQRELGLPVKPSDISGYHGRSLDRIFNDPNAPDIVPSGSTRASREPLAVLEAAFEKTRSPGSSTCCLVFLDPEAGTAKTLNLGDSGCIIIRGNLPGEVVFRSEIQQHEHNFPYQLGPMSSDRPSDAKIEETPLARGDWVVVATDGVWDNLHEKQILTILSNVSSPAQGAREIGEQAVQYSLDDHWDSPFSEKERGYQLDMVMRKFLGVKKAFVNYEESLDANLQRAIACGLGQPLVRAISAIRGGKSDDISVVVARVV